MKGARSNCFGFTWPSALAAAVWLAAPAAVAADVSLDAVPMHDKKIRLDGMLREWPQRANLSQTVSGSVAQGDPKASAVIGYDHDALYVAMDVRDAEFVPHKDYAELRLSFPLASGGYKTYAVKLEPGDAGKTAGAVSVGGRNVTDAKLVEAPNADGFSFEAKIPWTAFPEASTTRVGLRGALVYNDADGNSKVVVGTSKQQGAGAPPLTIEAEYALLHQLVGAKGLSPRPVREALGNLVGDKMKERVAIYDRFLTVTGYGYRGGSEFFYHDLQAKRVKLLRLVDFNADGFDEVVVVRERAAGGDEQELLEVWRFPTESGAPVLLFQHEVGLSSGDNRVQNEVEVTTFKGKPALAVRVAKGKVDVATWAGVPAGGETKPVLLPWQPVSSRTYAWQNAGFEQVEEKSSKPLMEAPAAKGTRFYSASAPPPGYGAPADTKKADEADVDGEASGDAPPPARPPTAEELMDRVYELYRSERGAKKAKPRFDFVTNVAGDETVERVVVHGKDIVVFGKKFLQGRSYAYTTIGVERPEDVLQVNTVDLTGDGHAELVVHGVIRAQASKKLGGDVVTRHGMFVYRILESGITRVFAAETGRAVGDNVVLGSVRFVPATAGAVRIELHPGRAVGWTEQTYPFPEDRGPYGGLEPLLLPWTEQAPRTYSYSGGKFVQH